MYTIQIPRESQSANKFAYSHWRVRSSDKQTWLLLLNSALAKSPIPKARGRRHIVFTMYRKRMLDDDNASGGLKHLRDCLKVTGMILDDNAGGAEFKYVQAYAKESPTGKPMTVITIQDEGGLDATSEQLPVVSRSN